MLKRVSRMLVQKIEKVVASRTTPPEPSVIGICDINKNVVARVIMIPGGGAIDYIGPRQPDFYIPQRLEKVVRARKRRVIIYGGRGSAKTRTITNILTERMRLQRERVLCTREIQDSIDDSVKQEIADAIIENKWTSEFGITEKKIRCGSTRAFAIFQGLYRNVTKVKGKSRISILWIEEGENITQMSLDIVLPTIRESGSQVFISFNPREENDPIWVEFVAPYLSQMVDGVYEDDDTLIIECNFEHNPWFTEELKLERDKMARTDADRYQWIWLGKFRKGSSVKILNGKWIVEEFAPQAHWDGPYFGADFGFARDPSTLVKLWIDSDANRLYVEHEAKSETKGTGIELDDMAKFYAGRDGATPEELAKWTARDDAKWPGVPGAKRHKIRGDCSRPETISHIKRKGFDIEGAEKWDGSVEDGVAHLRSYDVIVIHPRCTGTIGEAAAYSYKVDRLTGDILPDIVDAYNHYIDAIRYGLAPIIKRKGKGLLDAFMASKKNRR